MKSLAATNVGPVLCVGMPQSGHSAAMAAPGSGTAEDANKSQLALKRHQPPCLPKMWRSQSILSRRHRQYYSLCCHSGIAHQHPNSHVTPAYGAHKRRQVYSGTSHNGPVSLHRAAGRLMTMNLFTKVEPTGVLGVAKASAERNSGSPCSPMISATDPIGTVPFCSGTSAQSVGETSNPRAFSSSNGDATSTMPLEIMGPDDSRGSSQVRPLDTHPGQRDPGSSDTGAETSQSTETDDLLAQIPSGFVPITVSKANLQSAIEIIKAGRNSGLPKTVDVTPECTNLSDRLPRARRGVDLAYLSRKLKSVWKRKRRMEPLKTIREQRMRLPILQAATAERFHNLVKHSDVVVVRSHTGSGKTTQIPQMIFDHAIDHLRGASINIICTQPRRISATSIAKRVAYERGEQLQDTVGFHIKDQNRTSTKHGCINYCTSGILVNQLLHDPETTCSTYSHIIIDEAHERDIYVDLLLSELRKEIRSRKAQRKRCPKLIVMSATIDAGSFTRYLGQPGVNEPSLRVESLEIEANGFDVHEHYLPEILDRIAKEASHDLEAGALVNDENSASREYITNEMRFATQKSEPEEPRQGPSFDETTEAAVVSESLDGLSVQAPELISNVIAHVVKTQPSGDVLVFLPGLSEIDQVTEMLSTWSSVDFKDDTKYRLFKLHSSLKETNNSVFEPVPEGCRRVILATNIAETSITLPDIEHVIDSGRAREFRFDPMTNVKALPAVWESTANLMQRKGRAGRVRCGHYYALFTRQRAESFNPMPVPEILASDLTRTCLQLKAQHRPVIIEDFFASIIDPPKPEAVQSAIDHLQSLGALTDEQELTNLGRILSQLPLHPAMGKSVLLGLVFGCLEPMLILACHNPDLPFIHQSKQSARTLRNVAKEYASDTESDLYSLIESFRHLHNAVCRGARDEAKLIRETKFVRHSAYKSIVSSARQVCEALVDIGILPVGNYHNPFGGLPESVNMHSKNVLLVKSLALNTITPNIAVWARRRRDLQLPFGSSSKKTNWWLTKDSILPGTDASVATFSRPSVLTSDKPVVQSKNRPVGRLTSYLWKTAAWKLPSGMDAMNLHYNSMITPMTAIAFNRHLSLVDDNTLLVDKWLPLRITGSLDAPAPLSTAPARVLVEMRKTVDRFLTIALSNVDRAGLGDRSSNHISPIPIPKTRGSHRRRGLQKLRDRETDDNPPATPIDHRLHASMVSAIVKLLDEDDTYWKGYAAQRREHLQQEAKEKAAEQVETPQDAILHETAERPVIEIPKHDSLVSPFYRQDPTSFPKAASKWEVSRSALPKE